MKNILTLILYFQICIAFGQSFNVTTKDFFLNIKELIKPATKVELTHAIKHKDKFYCFFEDGEEDIKFCFVFSYGGNKLNKIEVPIDVYAIFKNTVIKSEDYIMKHHYNIYCSEVEECNQ